MTGERRPEDPEGADRGHGPDGGRGQDPAEQERAWEDIVSRLQAEMPSGQGLPDDAAPGVSPGPGAPRGDGTPGPDGPSVPPWPVLRPEPVEDKDLPGDFVPPEPPPLLSGRPTLVLATCALLLPLCALLLLVVLPVSLPGWALFALVVVAVCGGVGLFLQLPRRGDGRGDRLDRGAQV